MSSAILHRSLDKTYPEAVSGEGVFLITRAGDRILDGSSGAAVSCLGHNNREVIDAIVKQTQSLSFAHTLFFTSDPAEQLALHLLAESRAAFAKVSFLCSGSEAVESALKIARQYHIYRGEPARVNFVGRAHSYHGNTLGALAAGNNPARRGTFGPILAPVFHHVSRCFYDADVGEGQSEESYEDGLIAEFEAKIGELGPETVAAIIVEPVVGSTLGAAPATKTYLPRLRKLCDRHGILLIFDEVMCGLGRSGTYHAWEQLGGVPPDLQTVGKGLAAGYQPLSAVLMAGKISEAFEAASAEGAEKFASGHTFQGHAVACAGALTVQRILKRDGLVRNVAEMGELLRDLLEKGLPADLVARGARVRGVGLFRAVDFGTVGREELGAPLAGEVGEETFGRGAAVYPCSAAVDAILFAPPFIISNEEVALLVDIFLGALNSVIEGRRARQLSS
ncbi:related to ARG8 - acetylornithine aminotransferase [Cephalotrichum gorgonifer]|uniref:Related to ARG8 - acetylornithine aminotransferase n=1 Tax=Cephalotrichum gorgonifer TaxID=2041049 RepID=A0AAE8N0A8_9PEZI|nr:related to ARG8 - acetylornithine aminotransferase [Cephalotrichum gorgonifer]